MVGLRLNAPDGAGCSLTVLTGLTRMAGSTSLNAPDGAGCSLTRFRRVEPHPGLVGLNAPDGAGCSLTRSQREDTCCGARVVLMHLMVLGAP